MVDLIGAKKLIEQEYDIASIEDLATKLEQTVASIRNGEIKSLSVAIVSQTAEDHIGVTNMFAATNPHRRDPKSGRYRYTEVQGVPEEAFEITYGSFLGCLDTMYTAEYDQDGNMNQIELGNYPHLIVRTEDED